MFTFQATNKETDVKSNQINVLLNEVERLKTEHQSVASKLDNMKMYVKFSNLNY